MTNLIPATHSKHWKLWINHVRLVKLCMQHSIAASEVHSIGDLTDDIMMDTVDLYGSAELTINSHWLLHAKTFIFWSVESLSLLFFVVVVFLVLPYFRIGLVSSVDIGPSPKSQSSSRPRRPPARRPTTNRSPTPVSASSSWSDSSLRFFPPIVTSQ